MVECLNVGSSYTLVLIFKRGNEQLYPISDWSLPVSKNPTILRRMSALKSNQEIIAQFKALGGGRTSIIAVGGCVSWDYQDQWWQQTVQIG